METTLTIRLSTADRDALRRRARSEGCSESALVRVLLKRETERGFDFARVDHLAGVLESRRRKSTRRVPWRERIRERNWRP